MENNKNILKTIRLKLDLNQSEMADKLGILQGSYSAVENGNNGISTKVRKALKEKLNVNPEYIETGEGANV